MSILRHLFLLIFGSLSLSIQAAEPDTPAFQEGVGYELVKPVQPTQDPKKIEVIEFFWYGCSHCYAFEPVLEKWSQGLPENVQLIRQPAVFSPSWEPLAKAYFAAEALEIVDRVHADLFDAVHDPRHPVKTEADLAEFFAKHGVPKTDFENALNSFYVDAKLRQARTMSARYGVTGVPTVVVNGKYRTSGSLAKNFETMAAIMSYLVERETPAAQK